MTVTGLQDIWRQASAYLSFPGHQPSRGLVLGCAALALVAVASRHAWPLTRTVVTIAHEGGHALVALLTGRRLESVRVMHSTAGVTVSAGRPTGPGVVLTAAAGYLAPPLLGLGAAALLATGHLLSMLLISLAALAALVIAMRNVYGVLAVLVTGAAFGVVIWGGSRIGQAALGYTAAWFLLLGGVRPVLELRRSRRRNPGARTDADQLARLTGVPAGAWVALFGLVALAALAVSAMWMVN